MICEGTQSSETIHPAAAAAAAWRLVCVSMRGTICANIQHPISVHIIMLSTLIMHTLTALTLEKVSFFVNLFKLKNTFTK